MKTAIFVDGAFFLKRFKNLYEGEKDYKNAEVVANELCSLCYEHLLMKDKGKEEHELYRIFFYDCPPLDKKAHYPISHKCVDFGKSDLAKFKHDFLENLKRKRKVALRLGRVQDLEGWTLKPGVLKKILAGNLKFEDLTDDDFVYGFRQKEIDMKIGIDIASVAYKKQVNRIVLIAGDADFVPAAKLARREGIDFILDPMWMPIHSDLFEHIDGLQSPSLKPKAIREKEEKMLKEKKGFKAKKTNS